MLHVFLPPGHQPGDQRPAIVFFFGGGWMGGSPGQFYPQAAHFAMRGMVAISAEYRTQKSHGTTPAECVKDAKSAIRWVRRHADTLGIDPSRLASGGGSVGGHLAAATATLDGFNEADEDVSISCVPNALVLFNPVFDNGPGGYGHERVSAFWKDFSPAHNIRPGIPPSIVFLGTDDQHIPVASAERFRDRVKEVGGRCDLHIYPNEKHGFFNRGEPYRLTLQKADSFLISLGYLEQP